MMNELVKISDSLTHEVDGIEPFELLKRIDNQFKKFTQNYRYDNDANYHSIRLLNHTLASAIDFAIQKEICKDDIRSALSFTYNLFSKSQFIQHIQEWPLGYEGDYRIVNMIIDRFTTTLDDTIEKEIEEIYLSIPITQQHREKINRQTTLIKRICYEKENANIISLACGSCRDIVNIQELINIQKSNILLIDSDENSLKDARSRLSLIEEQITFLPINIIKMGKAIQEFCNQNGKIDLVYAGGLFDYLPSKTIGFVIKQIKEHISDDGTLFFTNIKKVNPYRNLIEIMGNWHLIERDKDEILEICNFIGFEKIKIEQDPTKLTWLVECTNQN